MGTLQLITVLSWTISVLSSAKAVTLGGSSSLAVPGSDFTFTCGVPEEANLVELYRRPNKTPVGRIQVGNGKCFNMLSTTTIDICSPGVCYCSVTSSRLGNTFQWIIQPETRDNGSVWYCRRINSRLTDLILNSPDYTLNIVSHFTLSGSSDYAVAGREFKMTCYVPDKASQVQLYRRPDPTLEGSIQVSGGKCYNRISPPGTPDTLCSPDVCSCTTTSVNYGTVFQWVIRPQVGDHGSVWYCSRVNSKLPQPDRLKFSPNYTLSLAYGPISVTVNPSTLFYSIPEGQTLPSIRCLSDCNPACTYNWEKDGRSYTPGSDLRLTNIRRNQAGLFWCTASNSYGEETSGAIALNVTYGPPDVYLNTSTTYLSPSEGETLPTIRCSSDCNPACTYRWTKDGQSYTTGSDIRLTNIRRSQTGVYRCTASNSYGSRISSDVIVIVQYGPDVFLTPPDTTYTRTEGDTLPDITCTADCRPGCTFVWTKPDNTNFTASAVLSLGQLDKSEHGTYRCTARNVVAESTLAVNLTFFSSPSEPNKVGIIEVTSSSLTTKGCEFPTPLLENSSPASTVMIVVGAVLVFISFTVFGSSVFLYRKSRISSRSVDRQESHPQSVELGNVLHLEIEGEQVPADGRSHYQDLDPSDIQPPSQYESLPSERKQLPTDECRSHYQDLDPRDIQPPSQYESLPGEGDQENTDVKSLYQDLDPREIQPPSQYESLPSGSSK